MLSGRVFFFSCLLSLATASVTSAARPEFDAADGSGPTRIVTERLARLRSDTRLGVIGTAAHLDDRYGVPSFVWATRSPAATVPVAGIVPRLRPNPEQAARDLL